MRRYQQLINPTEFHSLFITINLYLGKNHLRNLQFLQLRWTKAAGVYWYLVTYDIGISGPTCVDRQLFFLKLI